MASEAQVFANRKNAQKSTGPRTEEGKAVSAQNAVTHGLLARNDVMQSEEQGDFDRLREEMMWELAPAGPVETVLAERIVSLTWRLKRAQRLQNEVFDYLLAKDASSPYVKHLHATSPGDPHGDPDFTLGRVVVQDLSNSRVIERLGLYERRIETSLYRTMRELRVAKTLRDQGAGVGDQGTACHGEAGKAAVRDQGAGIGGRKAGGELLTPEPRAPIPARELCETKPIRPGVEGREGRKEGECIRVGAVLDPAA